MNYLKTTSDLVFDNKLQISSKIFYHLIILNLDLKIGLNPKWMIQKSHPFILFWHKNSKIVFTVVLSLELLDRQLCCFKLPQVSVGAYKGDIVFFLVASFRLHFWPMASTATGIFNRIISVICHALARKTLDIHKFLLVSKLKRLICEQEN